MKKITTLLFSLLILLSACNRDEDFATPQDPTNSSSKTAKNPRLYAIKKVDTKVGRAAAETSKLWEPGDIIKIKFLTDSDSYDASLESKVKQYAEEWRQYANVKFEYVAENENADVKIGFEWGDDFSLITYSTIGTDCKLIPQDEASINFTYLLDEDEDFVKGEILRGFGHVLGLGFEHRNPNSPVEFKYKTTSDKRRMEGYFGMAFLDILDNLIPLYNDDQTNYTEYDPSSIMILTIPKTIITNPDHSVDANTELSETDKKFVKKLYPKVYLKLLETDAFYGKQSFSGYNGKLYIFGYGEIYSLDKNEEIKREFPQTTSRGLPIKANDDIYFVKNNNFTLSYINKEGEVKETNITNELLNGITTANGIVYLGTNRGLYYLESEGVFKKIRISAVEDKTNVDMSEGIYVQGMAANNMGLYFHIAYKYTNGTWSNSYPYTIGINKEVKGLPLNNYGVGNVYHYNYMFCASSDGNRVFGAPANYLYHEGNFMYGLKKGPGVIFGWADQLFPIQGNDGAMYFTNHYGQDNTLLPHASIFKVAKNSDVIEKVDFEIPETLENNSFSGNRVSEGMFFKINVVSKKLGYLYYCDQNEANEYFSIIKEDKFRFYDITEMADGTIYVIGEDYNNNFKIWKVIR